MKKIVIVIIAMLYYNLTFSQGGIKYTKEEIYKKAKESTKMYVLKYISKDDYDKYFSLNDEFSELKITMPFDELKENTIAKKWIHKITVALNFNFNAYHDSYSIELRNDFSVIEKIDFKNSDTLSAIYFKSINSYIAAFKENRILNTDSVYHFIVKNYPDKKWGKPQIKRNSFPPYQYYYEVLEDSCSSCKRIYIDLTELKEIGKEKVTMVPINGK